MPPEIEIEENVLYISIEYDVTKHRCACGCGSIIVTSLSPARWKLTYDGETVSLSPSIGNWNHNCQSHYFITKDQVVWAGPLNQKQINEVVKNDKESLRNYIETSAKPKSFIERLKSILKFR
jgi:hypothetical protein